MPDLTEYVLRSASALAIDTPGATSSKKVVPDAARLVGVCFSAYVAIDVETTAALYVNSADSGVVVTFPVTAVQGNGVALTDSRVNLTEGDLIHLVMNAGATTGDVVSSFVLSR